MKLFEKEGSKLVQVKTIQFKLEKDIQKLVEENLEELFSIEFVKSEFTVNNFRIDTLGFDRQNNSFVIIEYKKGKSYSVIDQGYTYMSLLLNNKSDFILEYNESKNKTLKRNDVDWEQSKILFISPNYTEYQKHSVNFKDVPFELWEIVQYNNGQIGLNHHQTKSQESITSISQDKDDVVSKVTREIKLYTEDYHFEKLNDPDNPIIELYESFKDKVLEFGEIELVPRKVYIGFKRNGTSFVDVSLKKKQMRLFINLKKGDLDDPNQMTKDVSEVGHWGNNGDYELNITSDDDLEYPLFLVKQSFKKHE
jgi:predicted transport protein